MIDVDNRAQVVSVNRAGQVKIMFLDRFEYDVWVYPEDINFKDSIKAGDIVFVKEHTSKRYSIFDVLPLHQDEKSTYMSGKEVEMTCEGELFLGTIEYMWTDENHPLHCYVKNELGEVVLIDRYTIGPKELEQKGNLEVGQEIYYRKALYGDKWHNVFMRVRSNREYLVEFKLHRRFLTERKTFGLLADVFSIDADEYRVMVNMTCGFTEYVFIVCRPDQFVKFQMGRDNIGFQNLWKILDVKVVVTARNSARLWDVSGEGLEDES